MMKHFNNPKYLQIALAVYIVAGGIMAVQRVEHNIQTACGRPSTMFARVITFTVWPGAVLVSALIGPPRKLDPATDCTQPFVQP